MRFDLTDLQLFVCVNDTGTLTAGARSCHMTLASASERMRALERALGDVLLVRGARGVRPTAAGEALLEHARGVLLQLDAMDAELVRWRGGLLGSLRLQGNTAACRELLPDALASFLPAHPGATITLEEHRSEEIVEAVRAGRADGGVVSDAVDRRGLQGLALRADPLALVLPSSHPLAGRPELALAEVLGEPFVGLPVGTALQEHVDGRALRLGGRLDYRARAAGLEVVCRLAGRGVGLGVVPQTVARRCAAVAGLSVVRLKDAWAQRRLLLVVRPCGGLTPVGRRFAHHLQAALAEGLDFCSAGAS